MYSCQFGELNVSCILIQLFYIMLLHEHQSILKYIYGMQYLKANY